MLKKLAVVFILCIAASIMTAYAENTDTDLGEYPDNYILNENGEIVGRDTKFPPIQVDENFDTDRQDLLNDETVKAVKIIDVQYDGSLSTENEITFQAGTPYLDEDQRVRVPIREFANQLGFSVTWYPETGQAVVYNDHEWYVFTPGNDVVLCAPVMRNAGHMHMDCVPTVIDGVMYLPLRHMCDILYRHIVWDEAAATATLYPTSAISIGEGPVYIDEKYAPSDNE